MLGQLLLLLIVAVQAQPATPPRDRPRNRGSATISGRVTEYDSSRPLPRLVVTLVGADRSKQVQTTTDAAGDYAFSGLEPGSYAISAAHDEHRSTYLRQWFGVASPAVLNSGPPRLNIELKSGEARTNVNIPLARALAIEGRISSPWNEPMADLEVTASFPGITRSVYSDDEGNYRLYGLAPGRYRVCAEVRGRIQPAPSDSSRLVRTCHPASVGETQAADVVLTNQDSVGIDIRVQRVGSHSISGSVVDAMGAAVDGGFVVAYSLDQHGASASAVTRAGEFKLNALTPGRYEMLASVGGPRPGDRRASNREREVGYTTVDVMEADLSGLTLTLSKPVRLAGRLVFDGDPPPNASRLKLVVQTRSANRGLHPFEGQMPSSRVGDNQAFELNGLYRQPLLIAVSGLPDGWLVKSVRLDGRDVTYVPTDFSGGATPQASLEISVTNRVAEPSAHVVDEQGEPAAAFGVVVVRADASTPHVRPRFTEGPPTSDGVVKLGAMLPGEYVLAALPWTDCLALMREPSRSHGLAGLGTRVTLTAGDDRTFELRLTSLPAMR